MTIENARALQEQLANEAIAQLRKNRNNELVDDCIQSIAIVGKAWGIPADETARRQARAQQEQTRHVGDAGPRETLVHGTMPLTCSRGSCSLCGICSKQHLTSAMMQPVTDCLILHTCWRQSTCHLTGLARSPL